MKIYLIGFMGAGKTTVGRELASRLGCPFFDLDELVEAAEKMSIKDIFAQQGEPYFRRRAHDILRSTHYLEDAMIAIGDGTFTFEDVPPGTYKLSATKAVSKRKATVPVTVQGGQTSTVTIDLLR